AFHNKAKPEGRAVRVPEEEWAALDGVYHQYCVDRTGYLERSERWWREAVFRRYYDEKRVLWDAAVWKTTDDVSTGYLVYQTSRTADGRAHVEVREIIALDGHAYRGLIGYILSHDLTSEITWHTPVDEPF